MEATLYDRPKVLQIGVLKDAILKAVGAELGPESKIKILYPRNPSPGVTDIVELDAGSLGPIVDLDTVDFTVRASSSRPGCYDEVYFRFYAAAKGKAFYIYAGSEGSYRCLEQIVASLSLEQTELEFPQLDELDSLPARVAALEKIAKDAGRSKERRVGKECRSRWSP